MTCLMVNGRWNSSNILCARTHTHITRHIPIIRKTKGRHDLNFRQLQSAVILISPIHQQRTTNTKAMFVWWDYNPRIITLLISFLKDYKFVCWDYNPRIINLFFSILRDYNPMSTYFHHCFSSFLWDYNTLWEDIL